MFAIGIFHMYRRNHTLIAISLIEGIGISNFHYINLPGLRPSNLLKILPQRPKSRPQTVRNIGNLYARHNSTILHEEFAIGLESRRGKGDGLGGIAGSAAGDNVQGPVPDKGVVQSVGIVLILIVAPTPIAHAQIAAPNVRIGEGTGIRCWRNKFVAPDKLTSGIPLDFIISRIRPVSGLR